MSIKRVRGGQKEKTGYAQTENYVCGPPLASGPHMCVGISPAGAGTLTSAVSLAELSVPMFAVSH